MSTIVGPVTLHHPELIDVYCRKMSTIVGVLCNCCTFSVMFIGFCVNFSFPIVK